MWLCTCLLVHQIALVLPVLLGLHYSQAQNWHAFSAVCRESCHLEITQLASDVLNCSFKHSRDQLSVDMFPSGAGIQPVSASVTKCTLMKSPCFSGMHTQDASVTSLPFNMGYLIFKIPLTCLSSIAICNICSCLLFQQAAVFLFPTESCSSFPVLPLPSHQTIH